MTEHMDYYGPEGWQTHTPTDAERLDEIRKIVDGVHSPDWPANAVLMIELIMATLILTLDVGRDDTATCTWTQDVNSEWGEWCASCGLCWVLETDGPIANEMQYCPGCGKPLREVVTDDADE